VTSIEEVSLRLSKLKEVVARRVGVWRVEMAVQRRVVRREGRGGDGEGGVEKVERAMGRGDR
jgi:hypothetical protein